MTKIFLKKINDFNNQEIDLTHLNTKRKAYLEKLSFNMQKVSYYSWLLLKEKVIEEYNLDIDTLELSYNENNKPLFKEFNFNISHSKNYIAVGLSNNEIGVDIQVIENKSLANLAKKLNIEESDNETLYLYFSAIEAKGKKEGSGILPSSITKENIKVSKQLIINDNLDKYVLSIDCEDSEIDIVY